MSFYSVLLVDRTASQGDIRQAYLELARRHHPDLNPDDTEARRQFKKILRAYEVLSDPHQRQRYDQAPHEFERPLVQPGRDRGVWVTPVDTTSQRSANHSPTADDPTVRHGTLFRPYRRAGERRHACPVVAGFALPICLAMALVWSIRANVDNRALSLVSAAKPTRDMDMTDDGGVSALDSQPPDHEDGPGPGSATEDRIRTNVSEPEPRPDPREQIAASDHGDRPANNDGPNRRRRASHWLSPTKSATALPIDLNDLGIPLALPSEETEGFLPARPEDQPVPGPDHVRDSLSFGQANIDSTVDLPHLDAALEDHGVPWTRSPSGAFGSRDGDIRLLEPTPSRPASQRPRISDRDDPIRDMIGSRGTEARNPPRWLPKSGLTSRAGSPHRPRELTRGPAAATHGMTPGFGDYANAPANGLIHASFWVKSDRTVHGSDPTRHSAAWNSEWPRSAGTEFATYHETDTTDGSNSGWTATARGNHWRNGGPLGIPMAVGMRPLAPPPCPLTPIRPLPSLRLPGVLYGPPAAGPWVGLPATGY